ncbi:MAG: diguanylate cyclase [Pseudomonadota bacterium]
MHEDSLVGELSEPELREMIPQLQELTERYKRTELIQKTLYGISELSSSANNLNELYQSIHSLVQGFMPANNFYVAFYDKENTKLVFDYFVDENDSILLTDMPYEKTEFGITGYILRSGRSITLSKENFHQQALEKGFNIIGTVPIDLMGIPLKRGQETIGAMVVQSYNDRVRYNRDDIDILNFISRHIVTSVERVKQRELTENMIRQRTQQLQESNNNLSAEIQERKRIESLQNALFEISELSASNESEALTFYGKLHDILSRLMHAPNFYIAELVEQRTTITFPYFVGRNDDSNKARKLSNGLTEYVIRAGKAVLMNTDMIKRLQGTNEIDESICQKMLALKNCWLGAPLSINGEVLGVIAVQTYGTTKDYDKGDLDVLRFVSNQIAAAMQRQRASQALRNYNRHLARMVSERTAELDRSNKSLKKQIEQRKEIEARLVHDAHHDSLTGLPNRTLFNKRLELAIASKQRYDYHNYALLFIDLDRFKQINDTLGHHVGDEFLKDVSNRIDSCKRSHDLLARLGGDEFVVLLDSFESIDDVELIAQRIVENVSKPFTIENKEVYSGASVGVVNITQEYTEGDSALRDADAAMYYAKNLGKNRYIVFDTSMRSSVVREIELENDFRNAFNNDAFDYCTQPIICQHTRQTLYNEFTLAWRNKGKSYSRAQFWELAHATGLNHTINDHLINVAIKQLKVWQSIEETRHQKLGITLSAEHLMYKESYRNLLDVIENSEINSNNLVVELAEESLNKFPRHISIIVNKLHALGVIVVLDNFGNELGSLNHLFNLQFNYLKLSAALTNSMLDSPATKRLVQSILMLAKGAEISVIADGIDCERLLNEFKRLDCHLFQGQAIEKTQIL